MSVYVPEVGEAVMLQKILNQVLTLRLFSNDHTPAAGDTIGDLTEVTGGGYVAVVLSYANWVIAGGDPGVGLYNAFLDFLFTGATGGAGTIYGYYITNADNVLMWEERFPDESVPFTPTVDSLIQVKPRFTLQDASEA